MEQLALAAKKQHNNNKSAKKIHKS